MSVNRDATLKRAEKLLRQGKLDDAIAEYVRLVEEQPRDWSSINSLGDLYVRAGNVERAVEQFTRVADFLFDEGFLPKAAAVYKKTLKVDGGHEHTLSRLAEAAARQKVFVDARHYLRQLSDRRREKGDAAGVAECLVRLGTLEDADVEAKLAACRAAQEIGNTALAEQLLAEPALALGFAARELAEGKDPDAFARLTRLIVQDPSRTQDVIGLGMTLLDQGHADRAFACIDIVVDAALLDGDLVRAREALQAFAARTPHIAALAKLVEVCVDGGFDDEMRAAQRQLADAYRAAGRDAEAQAIAEDLDGGGDLGEGFFSDLHAAPDVLAAASEAYEVVVEEVPDDEAPPPPPSAVQAEPLVPSPDEFPFAAEPLEIDLSEALGDLEASPVLPLPAGDPLLAAEPPPDIETVFQGMRDQASRDKETFEAAARFDEALQLAASGNRDGAIEALRSAARVPSMRFRAAGQLGRIHLEAGEVTQAIEWFERAAEAPPLDAESGAALLYDLADALERSGESARTLAVLLELNADAPGYRDVGARIDRLTRDQAGSRAQ